MLHKVHVCCSESSSQLLLIDKPRICQRCSVEVIEALTPMPHLHRVYELFECLYSGLGIERSLCLREPRLDCGDKILVRCIQRLLGNAGTGRLCKGLTDLVYVTFARYKHLHELFIRD